MLTVLIAEACQNFQLTRLIVLNICFSPRVTFDHMRFCEICEIVKPVTTISKRVVSLIYYVHSENYNVLKLSLHLWL